MNSSRPLFYGWIIVLVAFIVDFIAVGFFFYSYGVFFLPIAEELGGGSRFGVSMGITLVNITTALIAPFVGNALDRFPIKWVMSGGIGLTSLGFYLLSNVDNMSQFYLVLVTLTAIGTATMGQLATAKLVTNWFVAKRGTALGVATMGISLSGMVMPPVTTWLIFSFGWRGSLEIFAVVTLFLTPLVLFLVINTPEEKGLEPDGKPQLPLPANAPKIKPPRTSMGEIFRQRAFWAIAMVFGFTFCGMGAILTNMIPLARDMGINEYGAATILSASALAGVLGKVFFGVLADRANARLAMMITVGSQWIGVILILFADHFATLLAAGAIFGFGMGGVVPLHSVMVGKSFGRGDFGQVMGLMRPIMLPLQTLGLPLAGAIYDNTGSYDIAFYCFLVFQLMAIIGVWFFVPKEQTANS